MQQLYPEIEVDYTLHETLGTGNPFLIKLVIVYALYLSAINQW